MPVLTLHVRRGRRAKGYTKYFRTLNNAMLRGDLLRWGVRGYQLTPVAPGQYVESIANSEADFWQRRLRENHFYECPKELLFVPSEQITLTGDNSTIVLETLF